MVGLKQLNKEELGKLLVPEKIYKLNFKNEVEKLYQKLYFDNMHYEIVANIFFISTILALISYLFTYPYIYLFLNSYITYSIFWKIGIIFTTWFVYHLTFYLIGILFYFFYNESKFKKSETEIENDLPEFIDNLVSNLKGGVSLEKGLLKSVRIEQKALLKEVTLINEKIMMGMNVLSALKEFRERFIDSPIINRTIFLIEEGVRGGGNLAAPLERISENLKRIYNLDEEIKANSGGFSLIVRAITLLVAPLLFALALTLLTFIGNLFSLISKNGGYMSFAQEISSRIYFLFSDLFICYVNINYTFFFFNYITDEK